METILLVLVFAPGLKVVVIGWIVRRTFTAILGPAVDAAFAAAAL